MAFGKAKWARRIADLRLPRPRVMSIQTLSVDEAEASLLRTYTDASRLLADIDVHFVTRWEGVMAYAEQLDSYHKVLTTHAALCDVRFMESPAKWEPSVRDALISHMLADPSTRSNGLAASLGFATYVAMLATALCAYAVKSPSEDAHAHAMTALRTADIRLAEFESLERSAR